MEEYEQAIIFYKKSLDAGNESPESYLQII